MYTAVLLAHSWLRWIVVALAVFTLVSAIRARHEWTIEDRRRVKILVGLADLQMLLGLLLWVWLSPLPRAAWNGGLPELPLLVFAIAHPALMIIATAVLHAGTARLDRTQPESRHSKHGAGRPVPDHRKGKHGLLARTVGAWLAIVALAIPWPFLPWGRPLARIPERTATPVALEAPAAWARCVACHGPSGRGDGLAAAGLTPKPRSFADREWQDRATDERIRDVIRGGGATVGLSPVMPAHADLDDAELARLVAFIRAIGEESR